MDNEDLYLAQIANKQEDVEKPLYITRYGIVYKRMVTKDEYHVRERKRLYMQQYRSKMKRKNDTMSDQKLFI